VATGLFASVTVNAAGANGLFYGNPRQLLTQAVARDNSQLAGDIKVSGAIAGAPFAGSRSAKYQRPPTSSVRCALRNLNAVDRESGHDQNKQAASDYETAAEKNPVVGDLLEENEGDYLRHYKEDCNIDSHQAVEIEATFVDHVTIREKS
jgi:hypothetical protein